MKTKVSCNPEIVTRKIEALKKVNADGKLTFSGFEFSLYADILGCIIKPNAEISDTEKARITRKAIFEAGRNGIITPNSIAFEIDALLKDFLSNKFVEYILITNISIAQNVKIPKISIDSCTIKITSKILSPAMSARSNIVPTATRSIHGDLPKEYSYVTVSVRARSCSEAAEKALKALNIVRGVWNCYINRGVGFRWSSGRRNPVNQIMLGPIHTLHHANGDIATDAWWFEEGYSGSIGVLRDAGVVNGMVKYYRNIIRHSRKVGYAAEIFSSFRRYSCALDSSDYNSSLLMLWSELEFLTSSKYSKSDVVIRRCAFLFKDRDYVQLELNTIREFRNKFVHGGEESHYIETLLYRLKFYIEKMLEFHLSGSGFFSSLADIGEYLDTTTNINVIDSKLQKLRKAKRFLVSPA